MIRTRYLHIQDTQQAIVPKLRLSTAYKTVGSLYL